MKKICKNCKENICIAGQNTCQFCFNQELNKELDQIVCHSCGVYDDSTVNNICQECAEEDDWNNKEELSDEEFDNDDDDYDCRPSWGGVSWGSPGDGYPIYDG